MTEPGPQKIDRYGDAFKLQAVPMNMTTHHHDIAVSNWLTTSCSVAGDARIGHVFMQTSFELVIGPSFPEMRRIAGYSALRVAADSYHGDHWRIEITVVPDVPQPKLGAKKPFAPPYPELASLLVNALVSEQLLARPAIVNVYEATHRTYIEIGTPSAPPGHR